jgi:linoleate 10R-lipoxygenase
MFNLCTFVTLITQFQVSLSDMMNHRKLTGNSCHNVFKPLWEALGSKNTHTEVAAQIFAAVVPSAALYSQAVSTVVHYYLRKDKKAELEEIIKLGESPAVMPYVYEALS